MRNNSRCRKAFGIILLLVVSAIDQVLCASLKADGDKGQPEMVQPLDNHPMEWTVDEEDESSAAVAADSYRYLLMQRTDDLLTEALDMLARVKDSRSRRWLEAFIYKMGELAVELGGKHHQRKAESSTAPAQVLPTPHPVQLKVTPMKPIKNAFESQVTSTQLNNVLPVNEAILDRQVVTRPGFAESALEEDELVRQLHDQERIRRQGMEKNAKTSDYHTETFKLPKTIQSGINHLATKDDEKQLLMDLAKELNELSDSNGEELSLKDNRNVVDLPDDQFSQENLRPGKNEFETPDPKKKNLSGGKTPDLYFRGTVVSAKEPDSEGQLPRRDEEMFLQKMKPEDFKENFENSENNQTQKRSLPTQLNRYQPPALNNFPGGPTMRSVKNQLPHKNYMYFSNNDKRMDTKTMKQAGRFQKKNMYQKYPSHEDFGRIKNKPSNTARHPMLHEMLLSKHGHNALLMHLKPPKNIMDVYDSKTDIKTHNVTVSESTAIASYQRTHPQVKANKQRPDIYKKQNSHSNLKPLKGGYNFDGKAMKKNQKEYWNMVDRDEASANMGKFHVDQVSFPDQLESDPQLQHKMERQLRAGKVVMLSDSLVKANFNKNGLNANNTKMKENHVNLPQNIHGTMLYSEGLDD